MLAGCSVDDFSTAKRSTSSMDKEALYVITLAVEKILLLQEVSLPTQ
jgi:hypothetical protein